MEDPGVGCPAIPPPEGPGYALWYRYRKQAIGPGLSPSVAGTLRFLGDVFHLLEPSHSHVDNVL